MYKRVLFIVFCLSYIPSTLPGRFFPYPYNHGMPVDHMRTVWSSSYNGCYQSSHAKNFFKFTYPDPSKKPSLTIELCAFKCRAKGPEYTHLAVWKNDCLCIRQDQMITWHSIVEHRYNTTDGYYYPTYVSSPMSRDCYGNDTVRCKGNGLQICGGQHAMSVYAVCDQGLGGPNCEWPCAEKCGNRICVGPNQDMECAEICHAGWWFLGNNCHRKCEKGVATNYTVLNWGKCGRPCPQECLYDQCHPVNGVCTQGCKNFTYQMPHCTAKCQTGFWGKNCRHQCPHCTEWRCNVFTGICLLPSPRVTYDRPIFDIRIQLRDILPECSDKQTFGFDCTASCLDRCNALGCLLNGECIGSKNDGTTVKFCYSLNPSNGEEVSHFPEIFPFCSEICTYFCIGLLCVDGVCLSCPDGRYDYDCFKLCPRQCKTCDQFTGKCMLCSAGLYGELCDQKCKHSCHYYFGCEREFGDCNRCPEQRFGGLCYEHCDYCPHRCDQYSGRCLTCPTGKHGDKCELLCPSNCASLDCNIDGTCRGGCRQQKYYGPNCELECSSSCPSDARCDQDGHCIRG